MKESAQEPGVSNAPDYAASAFTQELIDEIKRDHFRPRAWRRFMSRSWARSLDDIRDSPARVRSLWLWAAAVAAAGISVVVLAWSFHAPELAISALILWLPWYAGSVFFVLTHLGMADNSEGLPHDSLLLPNGLSFLRLALAPLVLLPCLNMPAHPLTGPVFALFLAVISASDGLDGWLARRRNIRTRLGSMLDSLADLALMTFFAVGLYLAAAIPASLLWLLVVRYPLLLIVVLVLYFARGPVPLNPTEIGKAMTFATSVVFLVIAFKLLLTWDFPPTLWIDWAVWCIQFLVAANIIYLIYRGVTWAGSAAATNESQSR